MSATKRDRGEVRPPWISRADRVAEGKALREHCPRSAHADWTPAKDRADPVDLLERTGEGRLAPLIPIRNARMLQSPFAFYRGSALNMAADLAGTPSTGLKVQACGDCHLCNFGGFGTPERRVIADINDLDETFPAPWEWDVKRLAASFVLASRHNGFDEHDASEAARACVRTYREAMAEFSEMTVLEVWYSSIDLEDFIPTIEDRVARKRTRKRLEKARERDVMEHDFPELVSREGGTPTIKDQPPLIFHPSEWAETDFEQRIKAGFASYRESLGPHQRLLLDQYKPLDIAVKAVGVGSVGTVCGLMLLMSDESDPLFLQIKEARPSVLEGFAGPSPYANDGERVVAGARIMQAAGDIFLGWARGAEGRFFYVRQLRDMKIKPLVDLFTEGVMRQYAELCGRILARAHARSGEAARISGYLGKGDAFDEALVAFSAAYADQCEADFEVLRRAAEAGRIPMTTEEI